MNLLYFFFSLSCSKGEHGTLVRGPLKTLGLFNTKKQQNKSQGIVFDRLRQRLFGGLSNGWKPNRVFGHKIQDKTRLHNLTEPVHSFLYLASAY